MENAMRAKGFSKALLRRVDAFCARLNDRLVVVVLVLVLVIALVVLDKMMPYTLL